MSEDYLNTLRHLREISAIDAKLARARAEKKKLEVELAEKKAALEQLKILAAEAVKQFNQKELVYKKEEKYLRDEQAKLVDRRKALHSLQNYKLQQAAEKEIEAASKQLGAQEEKLIEGLDEMEQLSAKSTEAQSLLQDAEAGLKTFLAEFEVSCKTFEERFSAYLKEREVAVANVSPASLQFYERVVERYPFDAIVAYKEQACTGCFLGLGPQVMQEIGKAKNLVRCRGCGRILFLEELLQ